MSAPAAAPPRPRLTLLVNPAAGRHDAEMLARLAMRLGEFGFAVETVTSRAPGDLATRLADVRADVVVVSGGDGTINEVVGGLVRLKEPRPRLAVVPNGTANVLAHEYGLPRDVEAIAMAIAAGRTRPLHLGLSRSDGESPRPFFLMTSVGFDAEVVHAVEARVKKRFKKFAFLVTALNRGFRRRPRIRAAWETPTGECGMLTCAMAVVTKSRHYGGPFVLTEATAMDRPGLRLVTFADDRPADLVDVAARLVLGRVERSDKVTARDVARVRLDSVDGQVLHVQIDGEPDGHAPVEVATGDVKLDLIVPA